MASGLQSPALPSQIIRSLTASAENAYCVAQNLDSAIEMTAEVSHGPAAADTAPFSLCPRRYTSSNMPGTTGTTPGPSRSQRCNTGRLS